MMVPGFTGVAAEREAWAASLAAADCTNVNMLKKGRNLKEKLKLMGSKCEARCWGSLRSERLLLWVRVVNRMTSPVSIASCLVDHNRCSRSLNDAAPLVDSKMTGRRPVLRVIRLIHSFKVFIDEDAVAK